MKINEDNKVQKDKNFEIKTKYSNKSESNENLS